MSCPKTNNTIIIKMKFIITVITALTFILAPTFEASAKADKSCWITSTQQWPSPNIIGYHQLVPMVGQYSGGAVATVKYASLVVSTLLTKVTTTINGVSTVDYYTNTVSGVSCTPEWRGSITLPEQVLCNLPGNFAQVQVWAYYAGQAVGSANFYAYASAKVQGN